MGTIVVWRTDTRRVEPGSTMTSAGDHMATLDSAHANTERVLRDAMGNGGDVRAASLYVWESEEWARRTWRFERQKYLYRLEVDENDVRHRGDVNHYTDIGDALKDGRPTAIPVDDYIKSRDSDRSRFPTARFEVLVSKALVLQRFDPPPK